MQYILTQEEYDALRPKAETTHRDHALAAAREEILKISGFDCIHKPGSNNRDGYCDYCPCSPLNHKDYETWSRVCWLSKEYSK